MKREISIIGGGLAGLTAAIACAEGGARVTVHEAHRALGGRARSTAAPYIANDGTHVFYSDGAPWRWMAARGLVQPFRRPMLGEFLRLRFRHRGRVTPAPPRHLLRALARRRLTAPVDEDFRTWACRHLGEEAMEAVAGLVGVITYDADPGRLSAAFVWERALRVGAPRYPAARYVVGGWGRVIDRMAAHARGLGVRIETGSRVDRLPEDVPVIVATSLDAARTLFGDESLRWESGKAVLLDLGLSRHPRDLFLVFDLDEGGFLEQYGRPDASLAPAGHTLVQLEMPVRAGESRAEAISRVERLADSGLPGWRERTTWRREAVSTGRTGALDLPGLSWRDRPAIDRGNGVWLSGDSVAAPGLLSEVSVHSALTAAKAALKTVGPRVSV
ncbi:FAD-dependent oxidoreductase [Streptosporangium lutulentum]|uniref:Phytoene dehydrogenase-like protein n=1 Tax=Streptosporangium lutulentum TaxID=1461250 RepID=A0ABT9QTY9_9ACTN|nr:FAD-dependent oxidoreductase [Streptosporangium lutulentum]MDP9850226.1 phytoene dehydrogenase-like protein [Streptosporangium lutulentum]